MTLSSKDFARSLDTPPTMIDRNHTVIADSKAFHCIFWGKLITGKGAFVRDLNQSNGPLVFSNIPLLQEVKAIRRVDTSVSKNRTKYIWHYNLMSHMSQIVIPRRYACCGGFIGCAVMHCTCLAVEAFARCKHGTHCVISSQCHPRDYREIAWWYRKRELIIAGKK